MAQYSTDFSSQTVDAAPAGWTERYESASVAGRAMVRTKSGAIGGKVLRIESHTSNGHFVGATLDAVDSDSARADFEALAIFSVTGAATNTFVNVIGRAAGTLRTNADFCGATLAAAGSFQKRAVKRVGGTGTTLQSSGYTLVLDRRMAARVRASGTTVSVKIWEYDLESEPGTYDLSGSVSDLTSAGWVGFFVGATLNSEAKGPVDLEYFSVGTNGDTAVAPAPSSDPVAFTGTVPAQSWVEDSAITPLDLSSYFSGDLTPFSYAVTTGTLPAGLSLGASTGIISGTPTTPAAAVSIVVTATDDGTNTAATNAFDITITAAVAVVKGVEVVLHDRATLTPRASVTGITARWWDSPTAAGAPLLKTDSASTDGAGLLTIDIDSVTSLSVAALGYLVLYKAGAGADADLHFAGRVAVSDIA